LATPNYGFEKRQRELAKKRKKEEKLKAKAERKTGHADGSDEFDPDAPEATEGGAGDGDGGGD